MTEGWQGETDNDIAASGSSSPIIIMIKSRGKRNGRYWGLTIRTHLNNNLQALRHLQSVQSITYTLGSLEAGCAGKAGRKIKDGN